MFPAPAATPPVDVTFVIRSLARGGAERQLVRTAVGLARRGWRVAVATFYPGGDFAAELAAEGITHVSLDKRGPADLIGPIRRLRAWCRRSGTRIVYSFLTDANVLSALAYPRRRGPALVWGLRASFVDLDHFGVVARLSWWASRRLAGRTDLCIANSQAGAAYHAQHGYPADRMRVVPNGFDTTAWRPDPAAGAEARRSLGIGADAIVIGMFARLDPMKDHATLIAAVEQLRRSHPAVVLLLVGGGPPETERALTAQARAAGLGDAVRFLGARPDVAPLMNACDVTALISRGEGFPNAVGESMACGVPCVVTDVGDAAGVVGDPGLVVPVGDAAALADALARALAARQRLGAAARTRIVEQYGLEALAERTSRLLAPLRGDVAPPGDGPPPPATPV